MLSAEPVAEVLSCISAGGQLSLSFQAACGEALQITAWNLSMFEIIPVFQRIKLNPDGSCELVYSSVPCTIASLPPRGEQTMALEQGQDIHRSALLLEPETG